MSALDRIAYFQDRRDEEPNKELARALAETSDRAGIEQIVAGLGHKESRVRSDCIKVLYELGYLKPDLISGHAEAFLELLESRNNRLVWGAMTALSTVAHMRAELLCEQFDRLVRAIDSGSVITRDRGIRVLAAIAGQEGACRQQALEFLLKDLAECRPKDVPQHGGSALGAIGPDERDRFVAILRERLPELTSTGARRTEILIRQATAKSRKR